MRSVKIRFASLFTISFLVMGSHAAPTMRLDYFHTGNATQELFSVERVSIEAVAWPGNPNKTIDEMNQGNICSRCVIGESNRMLYSRGFSSIYGEWETTDEAKSMNRTFSESLRFPTPERPVQIVVKKRDAENMFRELWTTKVDPADIFVDRSKQVAPVELIELEKNGEPAGKVDFLILGDGYTAAESAKFKGDARRFLERLFATEPFKIRRKDFNVGAFVRRRRTLEFRGHPPAFITPHCWARATTVWVRALYPDVDNHAVRQLAQFAPYEFVEIITNSKTYGGGGIFNFYGTVAADSAQGAYIFVHEFGHHFADLADEYYTSPVAYSPPRIRSSRGSRM